MSARLEHADQWRDPAEVTAHWLGAPVHTRRHFTSRERGGWWDLLDDIGRTLLVSREYEHLLLALDASRQPARVTYLPLPHPSGIAIDRASGDVLVASTRNPNQVFRLRPTRRLLPRRDRDTSGPLPRTLVPVRTEFYPGCLYVHDIAFIGGRLYASAAGQNAIVELHGDGTSTPAWWPASADGRKGPVVERNHLQVNSIAAGRTLRASYFSASTATIGHRRPGQRHFQVDGRGVVFSGRTRGVMATGLTRPHSARLRGARVWVLNSGYGELGYVDAGAFRPVCRLPGWTRGLTFAGRYALVGTSRILPRFTAYAPGLDPRRSVCGVHAVDLTTGERVASLTWPEGDQIFALETVARAYATALPFRPGRDRRGREAARLFYAFDPDPVPSRRRPS
ncbi:MAG: DUF4915 domain-containing protein [Vicinamibacterales bacterium]